MKINSLLLDEKDNVAVVTRSLECGDIARYLINHELVEVILAQDIQRYHKFATVPIIEGSRVYKYGQPIGIAGMDIRVGETVHSHNVISLRQQINDKQRGDSR